MSFMSNGQHHHDIALVEVGSRRPPAGRSDIGLYHVALKIGDDLDVLPDGQGAPRRPTAWRSSSSPTTRSASPSTSPIRTATTSSCTSTPIPIPGVSIPLRWQTPSPSSCKQHCTVGGAASSVAPSPDAPTRRWSTPRTMHRSDRSPQRRPLDQSTRTTTPSPRPLMDPHHDATLAETWFGVPAGDLLPGSPTPSSRSRILSVRLRRETALRISAPLRLH